MKNSLQAGQHCSCECTCVACEQTGCDPELHCGCPCDSLHKCPDAFQALLDARDLARADHEDASLDGEAYTPHGEALIARTYARLIELQAQVDAALADAAQEENES